MSPAEESRIRGLLGELDPKVFHLLEVRTARRAMPYLSHLSDEDALKHLQFVARWLVEQGPKSPSGSPHAELKGMTREDVFKRQVERMGGDPDAAYGFVGDIIRNGAAAEVSARMDSRHIHDESATAKDTPGSAGDRTKEYNKDAWSRNALIAKQFGWDFQIGKVKEEPIRIRHGDSDIRKDLITAVSAHENGPVHFIPDDKVDNSMAGDIGRAIDYTEQGGTVPSIDEQGGRDATDTI